MVLNNDRADWFRHARDRLSVLWSVVSLLLAGVWTVAHPDVPLLLQLWIVALGVGLFGVLHGGLDHIVGEQLFRPKLRPKFQPRWWAYFALAYLGLGALVMLGWWLAAPLMLWLFLIASALHFGLIDNTEDANNSKEANSSKKIAWAVTVCLMGAAPILIPWLAFPQEVSLLFGWLARTPGDVWRMRWQLASLQPVWLAATLFIAGGVVLAAWLNMKVRRAPWLLRSAEFLSTVVLFWTLPPLLAFTWYFCFLHSLRHLLTLAERLAPSRQWAALSWVAWHGAPLTLATIAASVAGYAWLRHVNLDEAEAITRVVFWGLAALTFPHMLLTWLWDRSVKNEVAAQDAGHKEHNQEHNQERH